MASGVSVRIEGLAEFRRSLSRLDHGVPGMERDAEERAAQLVVRKAKPMVPLGPARNGHARNTIRVVRSRGEARVRAGDEAHPYYPWLDFGGRVGIRNSVHRRYIKTGRYIYPAYEAVRGQIQNVMDDELRQAAHRAGLRVR